MQPIIHPGFGHSGTTSLQRQVFFRRTDLFYCGNPYGDLGGIFSWIKFQDERAYDRDKTRRSCDEYIFGRAGPEQRIVVSDESLVEQTEVYYTPPMMPTGVIADRLAELFSGALVLFTIRNQFDYVVSTYLNLKKNYAMLDRRPIEDFPEWFAGQFTQVRNLYLRNLDYSSAVSAYADRFGRENIRVLPLELTRQGADTYLARLGEMLGLPVGDDDRTAFATILNRRPTVRENGILTRWPDTAFRKSHSELEQQVGAERLKTWLSAGEPVRIELTGEQKTVIAERARAGNAWLEREFGLALSAYGYPV